MIFRPAVVTTCCLVLITTLSILHYTTTISRLDRDVLTSCNASAITNVTVHPQFDVSAPQLSPWETSNYVRAAPRIRYQDNLLKDAYYITSWANAGFTNQFISYVNMIYLGTLSDRIPIVPPFAPDHHISPSAGPIPFGEIFDLDGLRASLRRPVLEWSDVKSLPSRLSLEAPSAIEQLGCWSTRPADQKEPILARNLLHHLGLDISYTRLPSYIRQDPLLAAHGHISLIPLAEKIYPLSPLTHVEDKNLMAQSPNGAKLSPGNHLACFDFLYFASVGTQPYEWKSPWSPAWRHIGRHLKFTDSVRDLVKGYVRRALQVTTFELPPFITVHARRGDFVHQCFDVPSQCLAPISAYARRVKEVQGAIFVKSGIQVTEVLITSDEKDPAFWAEVRQEGWKYIDHAAERTLERHGEWYAPIIDIAAQSLGLGFVGSVDSTVSIVSAHRVQDWNQGITRMVNWGGRD